MIRTKKWFPMIVFFIIYIFTSFIGTMLLLFGPDKYWKLTYIFTGQTLPNVYKHDLLLILILIFGSILIMILGYLIGTLVTNRINHTINLFPEIKYVNFTGVSSILFWVSFTYMMHRILSIINISDILSWLNFNEFIEIRYSLMNSLSFFDYVNAYSLIPLFLSISLPKNIEDKHYIHIIFKFVALCVYNIYIFQKRPLVMAVCLIGFTLFSYYYLGVNSRRKLSSKAIAFIMLISFALYLVYAIGIYVTTLGNKQEIYLEATEQVKLSELQPPKESTTEKPPIKQSELFRNFSLKSGSFEVSKFTFTTTMAFVGMLNRTATSAICYPILFPQYLDYYPLDLGQDIFGFGTMPDDSRVVYKVLFPTQLEGSTDAPFFVVLFSQGGLVVAFIGSFIVGFCFGFLWALIQKMKKVSICTAALAGLALLFALSVAMGSGRESLTVSYGLIWPVLVLCVIYAVHWIIFHKRRESSIPRICMLVTSGVVNDSRVIREATIASTCGYEVKVVGRFIPELGDADKDWRFSHELINIPRAENGIISKIVERIKICTKMAQVAVKYKPDIIHCNDFDTLPFGYIAAMICGSGLVYDSHEIWSENGLVANSKIGHFIVSMTERFLVKRCDAVISVSNAAGQWLKKLYQLTNLNVITNCPFTGLVEFQPKYPTFELLCHGLYAYDRGYEELIESASLVHSEGISVRLRGYGAYTDHYKQLAQETGQSNIFFSEKVPAFQVTSAASASHVGVILTRPVSISYELTVSNKIFECIAAGLPVILSNVPEHRFLNEKYNFGIILETITAQALANAAINLKNNKDLYDQLCENAVKASKELCYEKEGQKLVSIYNKICSTEDTIAYETNLA